MTHGPSCEACSAKDHEHCVLRGCYCHCAGALVVGDVPVKIDPTLPPDVVVLESETDAVLIHNIGAEDEPEGPQKTDAVATGVDGIDFISIGFIKDGFKRLFQQSFDNLKRLLQRSFWTKKVIALVSGLVLVGAGIGIRIGQDTDGYEPFDMEGYSHTNAYAVETTCGLPLRSLGGGTAGKDFFSGRWYVAYDYTREITGIPLPVTALYWTATGEVTCSAGPGYGD